MFPLVIGLFAVALWMFYKYYVSNYSHWESRGIVTESGKFPFGNDIHFLTLKKYQGHLIDKMYKKHESNPYFGYYVMRSPILVIRDPEIVKLVLAKEFTHFRDRSSMRTSKRDPLSHHLFNLDGERWRVLRVKLTPTFTSGKLKAMFPLFVNCAEDLSKMLDDYRDKPTDVKDITARYTTDTICSSAFGLDSNSLTQEDDQMRKLGSKIMTISFQGIVRAAIMRTFPKIFEFFSIKTTPKDIEETLLRIVGDTIEYREKNGIVRNDFLNLLMQLRNKGQVGDDMKNDTNENNVQPFEMDLGILTAQCFVFFIAGFETSSSVQSFCLYELAMNPDIQKRVVEEINKTIEKHGAVTYQAIQEMEYLDMVVLEAMRKYPTLPSLIRCCTQPFTLPAGHKILKGDRILIPLWSLHHDPKYFPEPEKFDPERFSPSNKESIKPYTYMPFGEGPRICIGMRFGLLQTKMGLLTILRKYEVQRTNETQVPIEFRGSFVITTTKGPIILKFIQRPLAS